MPLLEHCYGTVYKLFLGSVPRELRQQQSQGLLAVSQNTVSLTPEVRDLVSECEQELGIAPGTTKLWQCRGEKPIPPVRVNDTLVVDPEYLGSMRWGAARLVLMERISECASCPLATERRVVAASAAAGLVGGIATIQLRRQLGRTARHLRYAWPVAALCSSATVMAAAATEAVAEPWKPALRTALRACNCAVSARDLLEHERELAAAPVQLPPGMPGSGPPPEMLKAEAELMKARSVDRQRVIAQWVESAPAAVVRHEQQRLMAAAEAGTPTEGFTVRQLEHARKAVERERALAA
eukprot:TRINITY_DN7714_c0_g1_i1.p3 TRINITY_DN7714_c0_g1~~TRINITY_DN7714_c0_g1_i1.p3  ORF type:complete len:296 (+),score=92.58 TRINITY_DN7714_c0_g1_i1:71-958(+)